MSILCTTGTHEIHETVRLAPATYHNYTVPHPCDPAPELAPTSSPVLARLYLHEFRRLRPLLVPEPGPACIQSVRSCVDILLHPTSQPPNQLKATVLAHRSSELTQVLVLRLHPGDGCPATLAVAAKCPAHPSGVLRSVKQPPATRAAGPPALA